jgi:hypothetical protein
MYWRAARVLISLVPGTWEPSCWLDGSPPPLQITAWGRLVPILDLALERGETSSHETVEEAKKHAGAALRLGLDWE